MDDPTGEKKQMRPRKQQTGANLGDQSVSTASHGFMSLSTSVSAHTVMRAQRSISSTANRVRKILSGNRNKDGTGDDEEDSGSDGSGKKKKKKKNRAKSAKRAVSAMV